MPTPTRSTDRDFVRELFVRQLELSLHKVSDSWRQITQGPHQPFFKLSVSWDDALRYLDHYDRVLRQTDKLLSETVMLEHAENDTVIVSVPLPAGFGTIVSHATPQIIDFLEERSPDITDYFGVEP